MKRPSTVPRNYIALMACWAVLFGALAYHEFVLEPSAYASGDKAFYSPEHLAIFELAIYAIAPVVLLASWFLLRRTLRPLREITLRIDAWDAEGGLEISDTRSVSPATSEVAAALNRASVRIQSAFKQIRQFSLLASHEIKTPLTILRAQSETDLRLAEARGDSDAADRIGSQLDEIDRLARIVDNLGLLARSDGGILALKLEPGHLDGLAKEFLEDLQVLAEPEGITVRTSIREPAPAIFDRQRMRQVFLALADNAVKYNRRNGTIVVGAGIEGDNAILWVENTGTPPDIAEVDQVCAPFFRGSNAKQGTEGSGLGLSIARSILEAHKGTLVFEVCPPDHTRVTIRFARHSG